MHACMFHEKAKALRNMVNHIGVPVVFPQQ
jgi:hypothetical protein